MTEDRLDDQIRSTIAGLAGSAPPAPEFRRIAEHLPASARAAAPLTVVEGDDELDLSEPAYVSDGPQRGRPWRLMAALVAFTLAAAGGVFAYGSFSGDDGAESPEAAVESFVGALADSDVAGMLEALAPSERIVLRESLESLKDQADRLGLTDGLDLDDVDGVELEVAGLELSSNGLGPDVAKVNVRGSLRSTATDAELPLGQLARDLLADALPEDGYQGIADALDEAINEEARSGIELVTVREGDRWHLSVWYSAAEVLRTAEGLPVPNFGQSPIQPVGADSPEAAFRALLETTGNFERAVSLATPVESKVLYDYVPVWAANQDDDRRVSDYQIHALETRVEGEGERRIVRVESYDLEWTTPYTYTEIYDEVGGELSEPREVTDVTHSRHAFDGDCFRTRYESDLADPEFDPQEEETCRAEALENGVSALQWTLATTVQVTTERHNGRWFVSPIRSLVDLSTAKLAMLPDGDTFRSLVDDDPWGGYLLLPYDLIDLVFSGVPSTAFIFSDEGESGEVTEIAGENGGVDVTETTSVPTTSMPASTVPSPSETATTAPAPPDSTVPDTDGPETTIPTTTSGG